MALDNTDMEIWKAECNPGERLLLMQIAQTEKRLSRPQDKALSGAIIGDGNRRRGVHAAPSKKTNVLFLEKIAPPSTS